MHEVTYMDPLNDHITSSSFAAQHQERESKIEHYRKHPFEVKLLFAICCAAPVFIIGVFIGLQYINMYVLAASFMGIILFYFYMTSLQQEVILLLLCEKNGWAFNPDPDYSRVGRLAKLFPDIFDRGDPLLRKVDNQIWGTFKKDNEFSFWASMFHYEQNEDSLEMKNNYDMMHYTKIFDRDKDISDKPVFIIELPTVLPVSFSLFSYGMQRDMKTESIEFNNKYRILLQDKGKHAKARTVQLLSPSVIVLLIEFANKYSVDCISFRHNCMAVLFNEPVWDTEHTNFIKRVAIDERDRRKYDKLLEQITELSVEIRKYLD